MQIRFDRKRMLAGEPCVDVGGEYWPGFTATRGVFFLRANGGHAWIDCENTALEPEGRVVAPTVRIEQRGLNWFPTDQLALLDDGRSYGAVNYGRVKAGKDVAVTVYTEDLSVVCPVARFDALPSHPFRSVIVDPPDDRAATPLNAWVEGWHMEY